MMGEVDGTKGAGLMAHYRYELTGELYGDDKIRGFYENDIVNLEQVECDEITFES